MIKRGKVLKNAVTRKKNFCEINSLVISITYTMIRQKNVDFWVKFVICTLPKKINTDLIWRRWGGSNRRLEALFDLSKTWAGQWSWNISSTVSTGYPGIVTGSWWTWLTGSGGVCHFDGVHVFHFGGWSRCCYCRGCRIRIGFWRRGWIGSFGSEKKYFLFSWKTYFEEKIGKVAQCGNDRIFLPLTFYVKSKLAILEPQKLPIYNI